MAHHHVRASGRMKGGVGWFSGTGTCRTAIPVCCQWLTRIQCIQYVPAETWYIASWQGSEPFLLTNTGRSVFLFLNRIWKDLWQQTFDDISQLLNKFHNEAGCQASLLLFLLVVRVRSQNIHRTHCAGTFSQILVGTRLIPVAVLLTLQSVKKRTSFSSCPRSRWPAVDCLATVQHVSRQQRTIIISLQ
jgi:hypothetical protein